jgi:FAD/FMN-containing dehydrogenase
LQTLCKNSCNTSYGVRSCQASQLKSLRLLVANGTIVNITPETHPHLWRAAGVSVGRLGIIVDLTMRIVHQRAVRRSMQDLSFNNFAAQVKAVQQQYVAAKGSKNVDAMKEAIYQLDETQVWGARVLLRCRAVLSSAAW